jgi:hypothetical protein
MIPWGGAATWVPCDRDRVGTVSVVLYRASDGRTRCTGDGNGGGTTGTEAVAVLVPWGKGYGANK